MNGKTGSKIFTIFLGVASVAIAGLAIAGINNAYAREDIKQKDNLMQKFTTAAEYKQWQTIKDSANARYIEATYKEELKNVKKPSKGPF